MLRILLQPQVELLYQHPTPTQGSQSIVEEEVGGMYELEERKEGCEMLSSGHGKVDALRSSQ